MRDQDFVEHLDRSGVEWKRLDHAYAVDVEQSWREIYGNAFATRPRLRHGAKAEYAYKLENCTQYFVIPFTSSVPGLPIHVRSRSLSAYECQGPLLSLAAFHDIEFFICPLDYAWTIVHTHEDFGFEGPFFIKREWLPG